MSTIPVQEDFLWLECAPCETCGGTHSDGVTPMVCQHCGDAYCDEHQADHERECWQDAPKPEHEEAAQALDCAG